MVEALESAGLISKDQHGFTTGKSCSTQLLEIMEIWTKWWDLGLQWDVVYTDFSKAFDSVPHNRLLNKLHAYGIRGNIYLWIKNFLTDRSQRVTIGQETSGWKPVTSGIPQGSVLGPILFTIFINDMPDSINSLIKLFADDTKLFKAIESLDDVDIIQNDINELYAWSKKWQLPFNINKCKVLHFGKSKNHHLYTMNNSQLTIENSEKDLGVLFDTDMNFKHHIKTIINKANQRVGMIRRHFSKLNGQSLKLLYKTLIRPILEYCNVVWFPLTKHDTQEIEKVQHRATKLVSSIAHLPYEERLKKLNLTTLAYRRIRADVLQVYRIINKIDKLDFNMFFTLNTNTTRGHSWKLDKPRAYTKLRQLSFSYRVIDVWNSLPEEVVLSPSINSFKKALERHWTNHPNKFQIFND